MTSARPTAQTRRLEPSHKPWTPAAYQLRGSEHLQARGAAVLWLKPGRRKTSIVLHAFDALRARGEARKMLVVAPKKVCQLVWRQEAAKWSDFRHLRFAFLHGTKKAKLLADDSDVHLINPEGVVWLAKQYANNPAAWPYDTVVFDEITKFKNSQADRSKALRGRSVGGRALPNLLKRSLRRWGATGTPNPNGYLDLFGQFLLLDDGAALGRFVTHYRDTYFSVGFNGFDYDLQPGGEKRIQARLEPYVFAPDVDIELPVLQEHLIEIDLEPAAWAAYESMRKDMVAALPEGRVEAANKAAAYNKLSQMAGGAVYMADGAVQEIHAAKLDALSDLMDEMGDAQMLIGYEFNHEKDRLKARLGNHITFLSDARTDAQAQQIQDDWNAGRIQFLACHPASAGHGLNLQEGACADICWFGPVWDLELWEQFTDRIVRSGNTAARVVRHILSVRNSIDELKLQALTEKDITQHRLMSALVTVLGGAPIDRDPKETDMVMKLQRAGASAPAETEQRRVPAGWGAPKGEVAQPAASQEVAQAAPAAEERKAPAGWGRPAGAAPTAEQAQREEIREKLNPQNEAGVTLAGEMTQIAETTSADRAFAAAPSEQTQAFSAEVIALKSAIETGNEPAPAGDDNPLPDPHTAKATRTRRTSDPTPPASGLNVEDIQNAVRAVLSEPRGISQAQAEPTPADAERVAHWQLIELVNASKAAGEAVAALATLNPDAAGATFELLFGAIEKRLAALGYAEAA